MNNNELKAWIEEQIRRHEDVLKFSNSGNSKMASGAKIGVLEEVLNRLETD